MDKPAERRVLDRRRAKPSLRKGKLLHVRSGLSAEKPKVGDLPRLSRFSNRHPGLVQGSTGPRAQDKKLELVAGLHGGCRD